MPTLLARLQRTTAQLLSTLSPEFTLPPLRTRKLLVLLATTILTVWAVYLGLWYLPASASITADGTFLALLYPWLELLGFDDQQLTPKIIGVIVGLAGAFKVLELTQFAKRAADSKLYRTVRNLTSWGVLALATLFFTGVITTIILLSGRATVTYALVQRVNENPQKEGLIVGADATAAALKDWNQQLSIDISGMLSGATIVQHLISQESYSPYFSQTLAQITNPIANRAANTPLPADNVRMLGHTIYFTKLTQEDLQKVTTPIARALVTHYFAPRRIKPEPNLEIIGRQEYLNFRDELVDQHLKEIDAEIAKIKKAIAATKKRMESIAMAVYFGGLDISVAEKEFNRLRFSLIELQENLDILEFQRELVESQKEMVTAELGIFIFKDQTIKVVLDKTDLDHIHEFLAIAVHEYLHYTTFSNEERQLPTFFEEGLTEYFTRRVLQQELGATTEVGYPLLTPVIVGLMNNASEKTVAEAYFTKDEELLRVAFDTAHGDGFFDESRYHFFILPFAGIDKGVQLANDILTQVKAPLLSVEALEEQQRQRLEQ